MTVMLLCYDDQEFWERQSADVLHAEMKQALQLTHELHATGKYRLASPLQDVATASCVRVRNGKRQITDGPFTETREVLGGFYLLDVKDMGEAIEIAAKHPGARHGGVEVRPVMEIEGLPKD